jgi:hypothetical protein
MGPNGRMFLLHIPFILHGFLAIVSSFWPYFASFGAGRGGGGRCWMCLNEGMGLILDFLIIYIVPNAIKVWFRGGLDSEVKFETC